MRKIIDLMRVIYRKAFNGYYDLLDVLKFYWARYVSKKNIIKSLYAREKNFGDDFNRDLVKFFNCVLIHTSDYKKSDVALTGSILGGYLRDYNGFIMGSGFLLERYKRDNNNWKINFIRGPLSGKQAGINHKIDYADPGIMASLIYPSKNYNQYLLGIIPNGREKDEVFKLNFGPNVLLINPHQRCKDVVDDIKQCSNIASSSLHGLVFADSFGIPNIHVKFSNKVLGGMHKFNDYYLGMDIEPEHISYSSNLKAKDIILDCKLRTSKEYIKQKQLMIINYFNEFIEREIQT